MTRRTTTIPAVVLACVVWSTMADAQLARQWVSRTGGTDKAGDNAAVAVIADDSAYVYAAGWMDNKPSGLDYATAKYDADGIRLWVAHYDNGAGDDRAAAIALDTAGNVYVTGKSPGAGSGYDFATVKYDNDGAQLWAVRYNGPGNGDDGAVALAIDDSMNVYVSGWSFGGSTGIDYAVVKYDAAGALRWVRRYDGPASGLDSLTAMALDGFTALYVTGTSRDSVNDYQTIRYAAGTGDSVWGARYHSTTGSSIPRAIAVRAASELYVTGSSATDSSGSDVLTLRYDAADGTVDWESRYDGPAHADDDGHAIALQAGTRVFVAGKSVNPGSFTDVLTIRYNQSNGAENWVAVHNGAANDDDAGIAVVGGNNSTVLASSIGAGTGHDVKLVRMNNSGSESWNIRYNGPANAEDIPYDLFEDAGAYYAAASSTKPKGKGSDFTVIKHVDPDELKYRTIRQSDITGKGVSLKSEVSVPNFANLRDAAFLAAYPKVKKGFAGAPGGLVLGQSRPDSATAFGWIRITTGPNVAKFLPQAGPGGYFETFGGKPFLGEKKNPKVDKYNNKIVGELIALRINIGASDAEVTPPMFGDLTYDDGDTSNPYNGMTLREIAAVADNYLTYGGRYAPIDWARLDTVLTKVNGAFYGPLTYISKVPFITTGVLPIDSVGFLEPAAAPILEPLNRPGDAAPSAQPVSFELRQNYPNPFNPMTTIGFAVPAEAVVTLTVYDMLGREVARLLDAEPVDEGISEVEFDGAAMSSGVYYYVLSVADRGIRETRRMLLVK